MSSSSASSSSSSSSSDSEESAEDMQLQPATESQEESVPMSSLEEAATGPEPEETEAAAPTTPLAAPITLSKSWGMRTSHAALYTGGPVVVVVVCEESSASSRPFLLLPCENDVVLVDAATARACCTVRGGTTTGSSSTTGKDDDDEDDDAMDTDAIVAFGVSYPVLLTASVHGLLRQYRIVVSDEESSAAASTTTNYRFQLTKVWGKSGHALPVSHIQFHATGRFVATGSVDGTVRVWDVTAAHVTHVFQALGSGDGSEDVDRTVTALAVTCLEWRNDASLLQLAVGRNNGSIVVHNLMDPNPAVLSAALLQGHHSAVTAVQWLSDGNIILSAGRDSVINTWQVEDNQENKNRSNKKKKKTPPVGYRRIHTLPVYEQVEGLVLLPGKEAGPLVAVAGSKGRVRLFRVTSTNSLEMVAEQPVAQSFGPDRGGYLQLALFCGNASRHPETQLMVADAEQNLTFLSVDDHTLLQHQRTIVGHNDDILDLKMFPEGNRIVVATNSAQVRIYELSTFSCVVLEAHPNDDTAKTAATVLCVDVSPCGRYIATCGKDKVARIWHVDSRQPVAVATGHTEAIGAAALSRRLNPYHVPDKAALQGAGAFCVTASVDRTLKRWNLPSAAHLEALGSGERIMDSDNNSILSLQASFSARAHEKDINIVTVAPNDSLIATGSQDKTVKLWRAKDLVLQATLKGHRRGVWDCQFSPYDKVLATSSGDKTVKLWSLSDYSCVRTFQGHVASVLRVRFLSGGLQLVSSGADGLVKLWTIRTNECETTMDGHTHKVWALDVARNGKVLVSGGADSRIVVWEDTTQQVESAKRAEQEEHILMDQRLANHLRHKEYSEAFELSLERDKPHQALKVLVAIIENELGQGREPLESLQRHAKEWPLDRVTQVLRFCREWNTRARNSHIAMLVVKAIVTSFPVHQLAATDGVPEILAGIVPYAERHFDRLDGLYASSYLLDFALFAMGSLDTTDEHDFAVWESKSKLVLPPNHVDGRTQVGGKAVVGISSPEARRAAVDFSSEEDDVVTVGDSDSSSDEEMEQ